MKLHTKSVMEDKSYLLIVSTSMGAKLFFRNLTLLYAITMQPHLYGADHILPPGSISPSEFLRKSTCNIVSANKRCM